MGRLRQMMTGQVPKYAKELNKLINGIGEITPAITKEQYEDSRKKRRNSFYEKRSEEINKRLDRGLEAPPYSFEEYKKEFE